MITDKVKLVLTRAAGDTIAATALIRDLALTHPKLRIIAGMTGADEILANNPYVSAEDDSATAISLDYRDGMKAASLGYPVHFLEAFHHNFTKQTGIEVKLLEPKPDIHLTDKEKAEPIVEPPYWIILAGGKTDMPTKIYSASRLQQVIDETSRSDGIKWVQVGRRADDRFGHIQPELKGVEDWLDRTSIRELLRMVYHSSGVLCGVTQTMLMAAAFDRPCVVLAGGREPNQWISFTKDNPALGNLVDKLVVPHKVLHTIGRLPCCQSSGCWACQVVPPHKDSEFPKGYLCSRPTIEPGGQPLPECMSLLYVEQVVEAIRSYS